MRRRGASRVPAPRRPALAAREVLVDHRDEDDDEAKHAQEVNVGPALVGRAEPLRRRLVEREQHERRGEGEEEALAGAPPEAQEEERCDGKPERHRAGEEGDHSLSQTKP